MPNGHPSRSADEGEANNERGGPEGHHASGDAASTLAPHDVVLVHGIIKLPGPVVLPAGAEVLVSLLDTRRADAPASPVAELSFYPGRAVQVPIAELPFSMGLPQNRRAGQYTLRAWIRMAGGAQRRSIAIGDYITTQSHPLNLSAGSVETILQVELVKS